MRNNKLIWQITLCLMITAISVYGGRIENGRISKLYDGVKSQVMHQLTMEEIKTVGEEVVSTLSQTPAKVVSIVTTANNASKYGEPIDEKSKTDTKQVHATAGGMVISSGRNSKLGLYVKIKHEEAVSIYGNLSDILVVENERVQRGEIIGSYDHSSSKEFYYLLQENI